MTTLERLRKLLEEAKAEDGSLLAIHEKLDVFEENTWEIAEHLIAAAQVLEEVRTNGEWTGGRDFSGEWKISKEVYEMVCEAMDALLTEESGA